MPGPGPAPGWWLPSPALEKEGHPLLLWAWGPLTHEQALEVFQSDSGSAPVGQSLSTHEHGQHAKEVPEVILCQWPVVGGAGSFSALQRTPFPWMGIPLESLSSAFSSCWFQD